LSPTTIEVIHETQSPIVVLERIGDRRLLQAAVHVAECPCGYVGNGACNSAGGLFVKLDAERASSRSVERQSAAA
jgi:hypothetical protein